MAQDKAALFALINANLPDNTEKLITPQKHREVSTQAADSALNTVETSAQTVDGSVDFTGGLLVSGETPLTGVVETQLLYAFSTAASQAPTSTGTPLQIEFGAAQLGPGDPVQLSAAGVLTFNQSGSYNVRVKIQKGRVGSSGTSIMMARVLINGVQVGISSAAKLANADEIFTFESNPIANVTAGDNFTLQVIRDASGTNFGGLYSITSSHGWVLAPSALIAVSRIEAA
jgi:hypothetical protein